MTDLFAKTPYATIYEIKGRDKKEEKNLVKYSDCVRIYCTQAPDVFNFQIRTFKPITERFSKKGNSRFMLASVDLSITELEQILEYCKSQHPSMKRVNTKPLELFS